MRADPRGRGPGQAAAGPRCQVMPAGLVSAYAAGRLTAAPAWSVEAHLPGCPACRQVLAGVSDAAVLARNRAAVLAAAGVPMPGLPGRILRRCGVPDHVTTLLAATPSLRRAWLAGVVLVLAVMTCAAQLAVWRLGLAAARGGGPVSWGALTPFLAIAPLLPLAAVALAFAPWLDPAYRLVSAAPVSKIWLLCVRSAAVIGATLLPAMLAALALPGPAWLAPALLLPALAVCALGIALTTVVRPAAAVLGAGAAWLILVLAVDAVAGRPVNVLGPGGQLVAVAVLLAAGLVIARRQDKINYGWMG